jgi:hypothetical protein
MSWARLTPLAIVAWLTASGAGAARPVVVELFTAQGCASCDKAGAFAAALADRPGVKALTFSVDYWDYLGWKDTFAQPEFTDRQKVYDKRFGLRDVYTPQIVVAGAGQASADSREKVETLIRAADRAREAGPEITPRADGTVAVSASARRSVRRPLDVWLIRYDPRAQPVAVKDGENRGVTVTERNVVRQLVKLGTWSRGRRIFRLPAPGAEGLDTLILVQGAEGGRIVSQRAIGG